MAAAQQESYYVQYMSNAAATAGSAISGVQLPVTSHLTSSVSVLSQETSIHNPITTVDNGSSFLPSTSENAMKPIEPEDIASKLRERLASTMSSNLITSSSSSF